MLRLLIQISCLQKEYMDRGQCWPCPYECNSCIAFKCTSCSALAYRQMPNCQCQDGYGDVSWQSTCVKCSQNCKSCTATECLECYSGLSVYRGVCSCQRGYYGYPCIPCMPGCLECDGVKCNACQIGSIPSGLQCVCVDGYYTNNGLCVSCAKGCLTCNQTGCLTCKLFRDISKNCQCQSGFFEENGQCQRCNITCLTCSNVSFCLTCIASQSILKDGHCYCNSGYQMTAQEELIKPPTCLQCLVGCNRCPKGKCTQAQNGFALNNDAAVCAIGHYISSNECLQCEVSKTNYAINQTSCPYCANGYYESTPGVCAACTQLASNCVKCDQAQCQICQSGYQLTSHGLCTLCSSTTCATCNFDRVGCASCAANYYYNSTSESCVYFAPSNCLQYDEHSQCTQCSATTYLYNALHTCEFLLANCKNGSQSNTNQCSTCNDDYYLSNGVCVANPANCAQYNPGLNKCTQCYDNAIFDHNTPPVCQLKTTYCVNKCTSTNNCNSCNSGLININGACYGIYFIIILQLAVLVVGQEILALLVLININYNHVLHAMLVAQHVYKGIALVPVIITSIVINVNFVHLSALCKCNNGYYFDVGKCKKCMVNCLLCSTGLICTKCKSGYSGNTCEYQLLNYYSPTQICNPGYYQPILNQGCQPCHYTCQTCSITPYNCQLCSPNRVWPCQTCADGYFGEYCTPCPINCATCNQDQCLTCNVGYLTPPQCYCPSNYYASELECLRCQQLCKECQFGPLNCTQCKLDRINPPFCVCPDGYYQINEFSNCGKCSSHCAQCVTQATNCLRCPYNRQYDPVCSCAEGYFGPDCLPCPYYCQVCTTTTGCTQCGKFRNKDCQCLDGYYEAMELNCQPCHPNCVTCIGSNRYNCTSCIPAKQLQGGQCECRPNYYLDNGSCLECTPDIIVCYPQVCGDGILEFPEMCDDGNLLSRDGCSNCLQDKHYYYCNQKSLFQPTLCTICSLNCLTCNQYECLVCESHYYYSNGLCFKCDIHCGECFGPLQSDCITCAQGEYGFPQKCDFCSQHNQIVHNGMCIPICGDAIIYNEQCDDGNIIDGDGCSSTCMIEKDWVCSNLPSVCIKNIYPIATLIVQGSQNTQTRQFLLQFSKPMVIVVDYANYLQLLINSLPIDSTKIIHYDDSNSISSCLFTVELNQSIPDTQAVVIFPSEQIYDLIQGLPLTQQSVSVDVQYYQMPNQIAQSTESISSVVSSSMLYSLGGLTLFGLSTGSIDFLWNMLDTLQQLQYLSQLNIPLPTILNNYLEVFSIFSLQTVTPKYNITILNEWQNDQQIKNVLDGTPFFLINIQCVIFTFFQVAGFYIAFNVIFKISSQFLDKPLGIKIAKISIKQISQFESVMNRIYITAQYDLNYAIFVTLYYFMKGYQSTYLIIEQGLAAVFLLFTVAMTISQFNALHLTRWQRNHPNYKYKYSDLIQTSSPYWAILYIVRKQVFMMALIMMHDFPLLQIPLMLSMNLVFLIKGRIFSTVENTKIMFTELTQLISLTFMLAYSLSTYNMVSPQFCSLLAMVQIGLYSFLLSFGVITDTVQKLKPALKKLIDKILQNKGK